MRIYLDNGATTAVDDTVIAAMQPYFSTSYGNASSLHEQGRTVREDIEKARAIIAEKINAKPEEILFTSGGTESDNWAIFGTIAATEKKHIITSAIEHHAIDHTVKFLQKQGYKTTFIPVDSKGYIKIDKLKQAITKETALISIIHANNEIGTIQDIEAIGKICKEKDIPFHTDAVQSFTKVPIDVQRSNLTLASLSAHKIYGPKGIGALYIKKGAKIKQLLHGGAQEFKLRPGTENAPGIIGFAKAAEILTNKDIIHMEMLRDKLIQGLLEIPDTILNGPKERLCNNVNISFKHIEGESILMHLDLEGISASTGSACSSQSLEPSHVLLAIGLSHEVAHGSIRFSLGKQNTIEEIDYTIKKTKKIIEKLRKISPLR